MFECPPGTWLSALARALGNLMGSHGGIWAIGPSAGTAPAARPPLVGLLWSGSSWATILSLRPPKHGLQAPAEPGTLDGYLSQDASEGLDARFVPSDLRLVPSDLLLIYRPAPR